MSRWGFFRQAAWIIATTIGGGLFGMLSMKVVSAQLRTGSGEFAAFTALQQGLILCTIPFTGLQTAFAYLAARAEDPAGRAALSGAMRGLCRLLIIAWLAAWCGVLVFQGRILAGLKLPPPALWLALLAALPSVLTPALFGVLQGRQDFRWLGIAGIVNNAALFCGMGVAVTWMAPTATGAVAGFCAGWWAAFAFALHRTRSHWQVPPARFDFMRFFGTFIPLSLGMGLPTFMLRWDYLTVNRFFEASQGTDGYTAARVVGGAVAYLTTALTWVLFPKIVQSVARSEKTPALMQALGAAALVGAGAALGCMVLPELPLRILAPKYVSFSRLVPMCVWAIIPLSLSTILINNLMARERYGVVRWILVLAGGYWATLRLYHPSFEAVIGVMGGFCTLLLATSVLCTWVAGRRPAAVDLPS